jgi:hypothetical protein
VSNAEQTARNAAICAYHANHTLTECAAKFGLKKGRVLQILKKGGVWRPRTASTRTKFLGVSVSEETKNGLKTKAEKAGLSVSKLTSDALDALVKP